MTKINFVALNSNLGYQENTLKEMVHIEQFKLTEQQFNKVMEAINTITEFNNSMIEKYGKIYDTFKQTEISQKEFYSLD